MGRRQENVGSEYDVGRQLRGRRKVEFAYVCSHHLGTSLSVAAGSNEEEGLSPASVFLIALLSPTSGGVWEGCACIGQGAVPKPSKSLADLSFCTESACSLLRLCHIHMSSPLCCTSLGDGDGDDVFNSLRARLCVAVHDRVCVAVHDA